jgi:hypothetical protein
VLPAAQTNEQGVVQGVRSIERTILSGELVIRTAAVDDPAAGWFCAKLAATDSSSAPALMAVARLDFIDDPSSTPVARCNV